MLTFVIAFAVMLAVVGAAFHWAVRAERRRYFGEDANARHH
jgi:nitrogen fixation-related uncharacterized protein